MQYNFVIARVLCLIDKAFKKLLNLISGLSKYSPLQLSARSCNERSGATRFTSIRYINKISDSHHLIVFKSPFAPKISISCNLDFIIHLKVQFGSKELTMLPNQHREHLTLSLRWPGALLLTLSGRGLYP